MVPRITPPFPRSRKQYLYFVLLANIFILFTLPTLVFAADRPNSDIGLHDPHYHKDHDHFVHLLQSGRLKVAEGSSGDDIIITSEIVPVPEDHQIKGPHWVELPLDHSGKDKRTFKNRYWTYDGFYKKGGPVILYDVGEADATPYVIIATTRTSIIYKMAEETGGLIIIWEHRFYGQSTPVPITGNTPAEYLQFLTVDQALEDIPYFANRFDYPELSSVDLTPGNTPWIMVGGSYPGIRATYMRLKYPETIFAAHASSAPVEAKLDFWEYFDTIWRSMNDLGYNNCTSNTNAALIEIDNQLQYPDKAAKLKQRFYGRGAEKSTNFEFTELLQSGANLFQSYGMQEYYYDANGATVPNPLVLFCNWISFDNETGQYAPAEGWVEMKGAEYLVNKWATFPSKYNPPGCEGPIDPDHPPTTAWTGQCSLSWGLSDLTPAHIAWSWQYCSEFGFFVTGSPGPHRLVSKYNNKEMELERCHKWFSNALSDGIMKYYPKVDDINQEFGGWDSRPSNIFFTTGEHDPWTALSFLSHETDSPRAKGLKIQSDRIPECGETHENEIFGYELQNRVHCYDMWGGNPEAEIAISISINAMKKWLKCFRGSSTKYGSSYSGESHTPSEGGHNGPNYDEEPPYGQHTGGYDDWWREKPHHHNNRPQGGYWRPEQWEDYEYDPPPPQRPPPGGYNHGNGYSSHRPYEWGGYYDDE